MSVPSVQEKPIEELAFQTSAEFAAEVEKYGLELQTVKYLCEAAVRVKARAACRYSKFRVGAAILAKSSKDPNLAIGLPMTPSTSGLSIPNPSTLTTTSSSGTSGTAPQIIVGVNVENASYPVGTCAERCAIGTAVTLGHGAGDFAALAVNTDISPPASPCGMCRQFIREFCGLDMPVFMVDVEGAVVVRTVGELLPMSFGPEDLVRGV